MCDPSFNKPWSRYYTLWRHQGPQKDILPRAPQNLSAALRIGNEIIEQTTPTTLERQITENLQLHFNTALNSVLLNDEYSDYTHRHSISCEIQDRISHGYTCHEELVNFHNTLVENPSNILNIEKIQTKTLDYLIKKM